MKRDMNLALAILKTLEENKSPHLSEFDIESALKDSFDVSNRGVGYQLNLLADANLVRSMGSDWRLTWDGHEFLKAAVPNTFEGLCQLVETEAERRQERASLRKRRTDFG
ncbi:DUF2513 domain-containing protein [Paraburkholderia panacisoli]|uniref:DUF2513 domain-containing protein n=1 Tax=Paraburkholderia panacisoli TaxID=2603818 RepID=UPI001FE520B4|nr:DUF2513 domain-containing protein [Paraburkholderia panacisoli]